MATHDIAQLERQIQGLKRRFALLADDADLEELLRHLHGPGWTTPAEFKLVSAVVHSLDQQAKTMVQLRINLIEGSREIVAAGERVAA
jgi:hypothetical protein